jgi:pectin methylesterase-like acyl-CoA thioesterase
MNNQLLRATLTIGFSLSTLLTLNLAVSSPSHQRTGIVPQLDRAVADPTAIKRRVYQVGCTYMTVQAAIDAAHVGDEIKIASGIYTAAINRSILMVARARPWRG